MGKNAAPYCLIQAVDDHDAELLQIEYDIFKKTYAEKNKIKTKHVYLSLGDKEEKTKNPVMKTVADCIRRQEELLQADPDVSCVLEWNQGNHFKEPEVRTAKGFAGIINREG